MIRAMGYALLAMVFAGIGTAATPLPGSPELDGLYVAQGVNPDGSEYRGFVHIARHGEAFLVSWIFPEDSPEAVVLRIVSVGVGIVSGEALGVSYYNSQIAGVAVYHIEDDGKRLAGQWTVAGSDGSVHTETLTKLSRPLPEPSDADPSEDQAPPRRKAPAHTAQRSL